MNLVHSSKNELVCFLKKHFDTTSLYLNIVLSSPFITEQPQTEVTLKTNFEVENRSYHLNNTSSSANSEKKVSNSNWMQMWLTSGLSNQVGIIYTKRVDFPI